MESYMLTNGLPVLFYCENRVLFKIRNLSKAMRKRANFIFKNKKITVKTHQQSLEKALEFKICSQDEILYFDSDYFEFCYSLLHKQKRTENRPITQKDLMEMIKSETKIIRLSKEFTLFELFPVEMIEESPIRLNKIHFCILEDCMTDFLRNAVIGYAETIRVKSFLQKADIMLLNRVYRVNKLELFNNIFDFETINWSNWLQELTLFSITIEKKVNLPFLKKLAFKGNSKGFSKIICPRLKAIYIWEYYYGYGELKLFEKVETLVVESSSFDGLFNNLPPNLRSFKIKKIQYYGNFDMKVIFEQCPKLIELEGLCNGFELADLQGANLRNVKIREDSKFEGKSTVRLKKVEITRKNYSLFNDHPEIISKCNEITIKTHEFKLEHLPERSMKVAFYERMLIEKKEIERYEHKLKYYYLNSIGVDKVETARKVLEIAKKVDLILCREKVNEVIKEFELSKCRIEHEVNIFGKEKTCSIF